MWTRVTSLLVTLFWVVMNVLLWRAEFGSRAVTGSPVPLAGVWERIVTAPDTSSLRILHRGTNVGFCRWAATVGRDWTTIGAARHEMLPEDMIETPSGYSLDLDGHVTLPDWPTRIGYNFTLALHPDHSWESFHLRLKLKPDAYDFSVSNTQRVLRLSFETPEGRTDRRVPFSELQNPQRLLRQLGGPTLPLMAAMMGVPLGTNQLGRLALGWKWQCHQSSLRMGHTRLRAYRVSTRLLDRWALTAYVSPVGEMLRIELPGDLVLVNDSLLGLTPVP